MPDDATQESGVEHEAIDMEVIESFDDGNTVGLCEVEAGSSTVTYPDARAKFAHVRKRRGEWEIGDGDSHIFISSDRGELSVDFGPQFAPIETSIKQWQFQTAMSHLDGRYPDFELLFDDSGLVVFRGEQNTVVVAPTRFPWDKPGTECGPRAPGGPTA